MRSLVLIGAICLTASMLLAEERTKREEQEQLLQIQIDAVRKATAGAFVLEQKEAGSASQAALQAPSVKRPDAILDAARRDSVARSLGIDPKDVEQVTVSGDGRIVVTTKDGRVIVSNRGLAAGTPRPGVPYDPHQTRERLLVLTTGGPVIVDLVLSIEGRPYRLAREKRIDEMLPLADTDRDGIPTWAEALNPRFTLGQMRMADGRIASPNGMQLATLFDKNQNGLVERDELRAYFAQQAGGDVFALIGVPPDPTVNPDVRKILDADGDGILSADELKAAPDRLLARDTNADELLDVNEILGITPQPVRRVAATAARTTSAAATRPPDNVLLLNDTTHLGNLFQNLKRRYARGDGLLAAGDFPVDPRLVGELDLNHNGVFDEGEVFGLFVAPAHLELEVRLGEPTTSSRRSTPHLLRAAVGRIEPPPREPFGPGFSRLQLPDVALVFTTNDAYAATRNYDETVQQIMQNYDTGKKGYLEEKDFETNNNRAAILQQFTLWDADGNGKAYPEEIKAHYARLQAPALTQIRATVSEQAAPTFFAALDETGDRRLSLREMRNAAARLAPFDKNGDGRITPDEISGEISITFGRGPANPPSGRLVAASAATSSQPVRTTPAQGPEWFLRMDRNGDGDLSPREFLGTPEQFAGLDADKDGFIDGREAEAAAKRSPDRK